MAKHALCPSCRNASIRADDEPCKTCLRPGPKCHESFRHVADWWDWFYQVMNARKKYGIARDFPENLFQIVHILDYLPNGNK